MKKMLVFPIILLLFLTITQVYATPKINVTINFYQAVYMENPSVITVKWFTEHLKYKQGIAYQGSFRYTVFYTPITGEKFTVYVFKYDSHKGFSPDYYFIYNTVTPIGSYNTAEKSLTFSLPEGKYIIMIVYNETQKIGYRNFYARAYYLIDGNTVLNIAYRNYVDPLTYHILPFNCIFFRIGLLYNLNI